MNKIKHLVWLSFIALGLLSVGCQSQVVPSSGAHAPVDPQTVKIYQQAPQKYEQLGVITIPVGGDVKWDERGNAKSGFKMFREQAAAKGANGVLLMVDPGQSDAVVTAGDGETYFQVPLRSNPRQAVAQAIYVVKP